ncbi:Golgi integral membrane protein 4-like isoform X4 [Vidua chalybeata]|uniref:Golgi integral membrane protein 4-like isoform X4 n=1 Tax=Vidua chalybeata TaxID=81927 RepID=UPI0023A80850|nr:Golgi integral membrane protein 4-like isoform X4 [Vidua chalybeata]
MGTGMCSRRQKGLLQTAFCLLALACLASGVFLYNHLQQKVRSAEALAQKYKQQQEALSAQLQVVYEHRSRLERSLQKERGEHKKTKEDFLVYKLEAQEALNKEKQDSMNRYGALSSQHKILKNQHDDVKKQLLDLQLQHNSLKLEHRKSLESHSQKLAQLQQEKDSEVTNLQDTVFKLREESKLLRKAHQEVHSQLLNAQAQMEEFRQLKEALQKMPGLRGGGGGGKGQQPLVPASSQLQPGRQKAFQPSQENRSAVPGAQQPPAQGSSSHAGPGDAQPQDLKMLMRIQVRSHEESQAPGLSLAEPGQPSRAENAPAPGGQRSAASRQVPVQSWKDLAGKESARLAEEGARGYPREPQVAPEAGQRGSPRPPSPRRGAEQDRADEEELEMDAGVIDRELHSQKEPVVQEPMMPDDAADPAQDPNNQGEDEFEEAELERPDFEEKVGGSEKLKEPRVKEESKEKPPKDAGRPAKPREEPLEDYQEDQEQEIEDHGGEVDDNDDLELVQEQKDRVGRQGAGGKKDDYF